MTTEHNPYLQFTREQWALLRDAVPLTLTETDLHTLRGINEKVSLREVEEIYLPLSRLLNLYVKAKQRRSRVLEQFLGQSRGKGTYNGAAYWLNGTLSSIFSALRKSFLVSKIRCSSVAMLIMVHR